MVHDSVVLRISRSYTLDNADYKYKKEKKKRVNLLGKKLYIYLFACITFVTLLNKFEKFKNHYDNKIKKEKKV